MLVDGTKAAIAALVLFAIARPAVAGLAPENTAVVVNGDSWASLTVAEEYTRLRGIPDSHVVVLRGLSSFDTVDVDAFRAEVLNPVFQQLAERKLLDHIDCVAYSVDLPYAVQVSSDMAGRRANQVITPTASANGLTYLHEWVAAKDPEYLRLDCNRYARRTLPLPKGAGLTATDRAAYDAAMSLYAMKKYPEAATALVPLSRLPGADPGVAYDLACCYALSGKADDAVGALRRAASLGWRSYGMAGSDPDLASLTARDDFKALIREVRERPLEVQPGVGFRSTSAWDELGRTAPTGPHYMLSTFLGVTSGRGNSVAEVLECLRRAAAADAGAPRGTIYFMKNGDVRSTTREWGFASAVETLGRSGVRAQIENGVLPASHSDVAGAMIGAADFTWSLSGSTILPGAICEHLTSFGGVIAERSGQTPCTDLIRAGAAGTSGTVTEPYALQQKFPTPFIQPLYAQGWTLAEAFYLSVSGPYQLLVIGDPLCRPWAKPMRLSAGVAAGSKLKGKVRLHPAASRSGDVARFEVYVDGRFAAEGRDPTLDTTGYGQGAHILSLVAVEKNAAESKTSVSIPVWFGVPSVTASAAGSVRLGDALKVSVRCPRASSIELRHFGRIVAKASGGTAVVDTSDLGIGTARLTPVAVVAGRTIFGSPVTVQVEPPVLLPAETPGARMEPGLSLTAGGKTVVVKDTIDGRMLSALPEGDRSFVLSGVFDVPRPDLYQLQIQTAAQVTVEVGGIKVATIADGKRHYVPLNLALGSHTLSIHGVAPANAGFDVRLGCAGAYRLAEARFRRPVR